MARGTQLLSLIAQLRAETGRSQEVSVGIDEVENLKVQLARKQEELYDKHNWLHIKVQRTVSLNAGQRYYDLPSDLDFDRIDEVALSYNGVYQPITKGINLEDYSAYDSNAATPDRSSPAQKWDIRNTGSSEQIEIWPIPNDNTQKLYFLGTKNLGRLTQEADTADLDDRLIVLSLAAQILKRQKSPDANDVGQMALSRLMDLKKNAAKNRPTKSIGLGRNFNMSNRGKTILVVS